MFDGTQMHELNLHIGTMQPNNMTFDGNHGNYQMISDIPTMSLPTSGWTNFEGIILPYITRNGVCFVPVKIIEERILSIIKQRVSNIVVDRPVPSHAMADYEMIMLRNLLDGKYFFSSEDLLVNLDEFRSFFEELKSACASTTDIENWAATNSVVGNCGVFQKASIEGGWVQINNTVLPFVVKDNSMMVPLSIVKYSAGLLLDIYIPTAYPNEDECLFLNEMCRKADITFSFTIETELIELDLLSSMCSKRPFIRKLPNDNPFSAAALISDFENVSDQEKGCIADDQCQTVTEYPSQIPYNAIDRATSLHDTQNFNVSRTDNALGIHANNPEVARLSFTYVNQSLNGPTAETSVPQTTTAEGQIDEIQVSKSIEPSSTTTRISGNRNMDVITIDDEEPVSQITGHNAAANINELPPSVHTNTATISNNPQPRSKTKISNLSPHAHIISTSTASDRPLPEQIHPVAKEKKPRRPRTKAAAKVKEPLLPEKINIAEKTTDIQPSLQTSDAGKRVINRRTAPNRPNLNKVLNEKTVTTNSSSGVKYPEPINPEFPLLESTFSVKLQRMLETRAETGNELPPRNMPHTVSVRAEESHRFPQDWEALIPTEPSKTAWIPTRTVPISTKPQKSGSSRRAPKRLHPESGKVVGHVEFTQINTATYQVSRNLQVSNDLRETNNVNPRRATRPAVGANATANISLVSKSINAFGKHITCFSKNNNHFVLMEAVYRIFFPMFPPEVVMNCIENVFNIPFGKLSAEEEQEIISYYKIPSLKLNCNKTVNAHRFLTLYPRIIAVLQSLQIVTTTLTSSTTVEHNDIGQISQGPLISQHGSASRHMTEYRPPMPTTRLIGLSSFIGNSTNTENENDVVPPTQSYVNGQHFTNSIRLPCTVVTDQNHSITDNRLSAQSFPLLADLVQESESMDNGIKRPKRQRPKVNNEVISID